MCEVVFWILGMFIAIILAASGHAGLGFLIALLIVCRLGYLVLWFLGNWGGR